MQYWIDALNQGLLIAIFAISLNVLLGYAGQLSMASVGLGAIGGYATAYLSVKHGVAFVPCLAIGVAGTAVVGGLLTFPALRLSQEYLVLLTLAFSTVVVAAIGAIGALGGVYGLVGLQTVSIGGPLLEPSQLLRMVGIVFVVSFAVCWRMAESPFGRVLKGIREDSDATQALGKNVVRYKLIVFTVTSAVAGAGGVALVFYNQLASPGEFSFETTGTTILAAVVIGGSTSLFGGVLGALLLEAVSPILEKGIGLGSSTAAFWELIIYGVLLVVIMRVRPTGLISGRAGARRLSPRALGSRLRPTAAPRAAVSLSVAGAPVSTNGASACDSKTSRPHQRSSELMNLTASVDVDRSDGLRAQTVADPDRPIVQAEGLRKHFGGIRAVEGLSLSLMPGKVTALVGPNGAGKTTVFNLLTGRIRPDAGRVLLHGQDITGRTPNAVAGMGMVRSFQDVRTFRRLTLLENVMLAVPAQPGERVADLMFRPGATRRGERLTRARARECLGVVGLGARGDELAAALGYGDQKLLAVARVLATECDVLLVDEPASGIDQAGLGPVLEVIERLRGYGKTICLVEHNLDVVTRLADHVIFMEQGRVTAEGTMEDITKQERLAEVYFGHHD